MQKHQYAIIHFIVQVGPDDWDRQTHVLHTPDEMTVGEVIRWARKTARIPENSKASTNVSLYYDPTAFVPEAP